MKNDFIFYSCLSQYFISDIMRRLQVHVVTRVVRHPQYKY